jgi:LPXTG-motif cell wall-anchored protein
VPALLVALALLIGGLWFFFDRRRRQLKGRYPPRR